MDAAIALPVLHVAGFGGIFSAFDLHWDAFAGIFGVVSGISTASGSVHRTSPKLIKGSLLTTLGIGEDWFSILSEPGRARSNLAILTALGQDGEVLFYANDAPGFYGNNHGILKVKITRLT